MTTNNERIEVIDWRQGAIRIHKSDGAVEETALITLSGDLHMRAMGAITDARRTAVKNCEGHESMRSESRPYRGPVASRLDINPRAHGNVTHIETCRCGATRNINVNGEHRETGPWQ